MTPPDLLLWLVIVWVLGPTALVILGYLLAGLSVAVLVVIDKLTP